MRKQGEGQQGAADRAWLAQARAALAPGVRAAVVTPRQLVTFHQCPLHHHLRYRRKLRGAIVATTRPLAEGNALHAVMRRWFRRDAARRSRTAPGVVATWLDEELPAAPYDDGDAGSRDRALHRLAGHAAWCLGAIPADAHVHLAERELQTGPLRLAPGGGPVRFQARLDLVVEHRDGTVEHVDFKTGSPRSTHWIQRTVERMLVGQRHPVGPGRPPTRSTTLYAGPRQIETQRHTLESLRATRADLRDLAVRMLAEPAGPAPPAPTPAGHCAWCPYRAAACPAHQASGRD